MSLPLSHIVVSSSPAIFSQVQTFPQATIVQSNQTMVQVPVSGLGQGGLVTTVVRQQQSVTTPATATLAMSTTQGLAGAPQTSTKMSSSQMVSVALAPAQPSLRPIVATAAIPTLTSTASATPVSASSTNENKNEDTKQQASQPPNSQQLNKNTENVVSVSKLEDLVKEVDTMQQIDDEVENVLFTLADDFIDNVVNASCLVAKNRKSTVLETKDIAIILERQHDLYIPGFGGEDLHTYKKTTTAEAHKQRVALVRKTLKKF